MKKLILSTVVLVSITFHCFSQSTPRVDKRQKKQNARIEKGIANGSLTAQEVHALDKQQARNQKMEANAMKDGKITNYEKAKLEMAQDRSSRSIKRKKHN